MSIADYITETRTELSRVSWPTRRQAVAFTALVIGISIGVAVYLGAADFLLSRAVQFLIS